MEFSSPYCVLLSVRIAIRKFLLSFDLTSPWVAKIYQALSELHKHFFRLFKFFDKVLVCLFDKTWWNEAHQNTFSLSSLFYYSKYNRDHFECEISPGGLLYGTDRDARRKF